MQLLDAAKSFLAGKIKETDTLVDFTMGNGHDTAYLCSLVPDGKVYAFDIQKEAIENTRKLLTEKGYNNAELILDSHANIAKYVPSLKCGMFNLGYRPGGDKSVTTLTESTLKAVTDGINLMQKGGVLVISVYPGHAEGEKEGRELYSLLSSYDKVYYSVIQYKMINSPTSPFILAVEKYDK
ncbi:MAG: class I SAM-dependent methyltransferase [Clostridia bacterium]|nr:class I SAM-dependent methyltransferase [Clostridia bacterium]